MCLQLCCQNSLVLPSRGAALHLLLTPILRNSAQAQDPRTHPWCPSLLNPPQPLAAATCIVLPLKAALLGNSAKAEELRAQFGDVRPTLLLFLQVCV